MAGMDFFIFPEPLAAGKRSEESVVGQFRVQQPGFFEAAGLLWFKLTHYRKNQVSRPVTQLEENKPTSPFSRYRA